MGKALECQGCQSMQTMETCWKMVVYWRSFRDFLTMQKTQQDMNNADHTPHNLKGSMDYIKIVEVEALEPCNTLQYTLKAQILERVVE
eukprot:10893750-Heterocapsa_arctica.AAC.1